MQLSIHFDIVLIAEFAEVKVVPKKYFPQPSMGVQSRRVAEVLQAHFSLL